MFIALPMQLTTVKATQIFHILRQLSIIFTNILLAKSALDADMIGYFEMLLFIAFAISFFWVAGSVQGLLTTYPKLQEENQPRLLFQIYLLFVGIIAGFCLMLFFLQDAFCSLLVGQADIPFFELFLVYLILNVPTFLLENIYLLQKKALPIVLFAVFSFGLYLVVVTIPVYAGWSFRWSIIGLIILAALKHFWLLIVLFQSADWRWRPNFIWQLLRVSTPLIGYALVGGLAQIVDHWLVGWYYEGDATKFAVFRYGARELPLALAMAGAFNNALLPTIQQDLKSALSGIRRRSRKLFHLLFPLSIIAAASSHWLYPLVFSDDFSASATIFNVFLLTLISRLIFPHTLLIGLQQNRVVLWTSVIELLVNFGISIWLVHSWGLPGIAMGTVVAYTFEKIVYIVYLKRRYGINFQQYTDWRLLACYSFLLIAVLIGTTLYWTF